MERTRIFVLLLAVFSLGWLLNSAITNFVYYDAEKQIPLSFAGFSKSPEQLSPSNRVQESQIHVYGDRVVLDIKEATWANFTDTNSMDPYLDQESNSLEIKPKGPDDVKIGDIISYYSSINGSIIVHRVINRGTDDRGIFYIVKGDNNNTKDPEKVRYSQVHGVLVGIIY